MEYLREKFGLNQQQLADFLGVSRGAVSNYENHRRNLPAVASSKHSHLLIMMAKMETTGAKAVNKLKVHPETVDRLNAAKKELKYHVTLSAYKADKLKEKLVNIQKQYFQVRDLMDLVEKLLKTYTKEKDKGSFLWLRAQYVRAKKRLMKCDEVVQLQMRAKISVLEKMAEMDIMNYEL